MLVASGVELGVERGAGAAPLLIGNIQTVGGGGGTIRRASGIITDATADDPVYQGDIIETAADGRIVVRFADGTVSHLSEGACLELREFVRETDGTTYSPLFSLSRGAFAFIVGPLTKVDSLRVDTPFGSIRSRARAGGIGMLSLAALVFSALKEAHAADPNVTLLDDDRITYKDLEHGVFELITKEAVPRHIIVEDPGETVVLSKKGSSISVNQVANTPARMAELQTDQQDVLANYAKGLGAHGSGTTPFFQSPLLQPINFIQTDTTSNPQNQLAPLESAVFVVPQVIIPAPSLAITSIGGSIAVAEDDIINVSKANAGVEISGTTSGVEDGRIVTVTLVDSSNRVAYSGTAIITNSSWLIDLTPAEAKALADGIYTLTADVTNAAGNPAEASQAVRVDETPPTIAIGTIANTDVVNLKVASEGFAIAGIATDAENGQPVTVKIVDSSGLVVDTFTTTLTNHAWSVQVTSTEAKLLHDGSYTVTGDVSDSAGNPAPEATQAITVDETPPTVTWLPPAESGIEGTAIGLGEITVTTNSLSGHSNGVQSLVVSGIPVGAVLTDCTNTFTATSGNTSIDVKSWNLSHLKITAPNDTNFILTVTATDQDANTASTSELVTVAPLAPALNPVAAQGIENTAIALDLGIMADSPLGDAPNSLATLVVSDIPVGATLSDGTGLSGHSFTATAGDTVFDVATWNLSSLTITPPVEFEGSFTLKIAVTERDSEGNISATVTATESVMVTPLAEPPTASAPAILTLNENAAGVAIAGVNVGPLAEDNDDTVSATLSVSQGTLHVASLSGVTVSGDDSTTLTLSGSAAAVNTLLAGLTYTPSAEYEGSDALHLSVTSSDGSNTNPTVATASTAITVRPVAEPPTASAPATATTAANTAIDIRGIIVGPAAEDADDTVSVLLTVAHGTLGVSPVTGVTETVNGPGSLTLSGTASDVNAALASLVYTPTTSFAGTDTLEVSVTSRDGSDTYPTQTTAATAISVTVGSESLIVGGPAPTLDWNDAANWSAGVVPTLAIHATINAPALYTVVITGTPDAQAASLTIPHGSAMTDIASNGTLQLAGDLNVSDSGKLENQGTLEETASASFIGPITNDGTIIIDPNIDLDVAGTITGIGKFWIDGGATLEFAVGSKVAPGTTDSQTIYFEQGAGRLIIDDWGKFSGVITGTTLGAHLTSTDLIDLTQLPFVGGSMSASVSYSSGTNISTVTFSDGNSANSVTLHLSGNYTGTVWTFSSINGGSGTEISDPPTDSVILTSTATEEIAAASTATRVAGSYSTVSGTAAAWAYTPCDYNAVNAPNIGDTLTNIINGGFGAALLTGGGEHFVYSSVADSSADRFDTITNFVPGSDKIDLTAFGGLSFVTLASTSTSVPAHTIAWLYDGATNEAIVYVNPTDQAFSIGDSGLFEVHVHGIATIEASDFIIDPPTASVALDSPPTDLAMGTAWQTEGTIATIDGDPSAPTARDGTLLADASSTERAASPSFSFETERDQIDYAKLTSSDDAQSHSTQDADNSAAIILADGKSIGVYWAHDMAVTEFHFVFDQPSVPDSADNRIGNGTDPDGTIHGISIATVNAEELIPNIHEAVGSVDGGAPSHGNGANNSEPESIFASDKEDHGASKSADNNGHEIDTNSNIASDKGDHGASKNADNNADNNNGHEIDTNSNIASDKENHGASKNVDNSGHEIDASQNTPELLKVSDSGDVSRSISAKEGEHGSPPGDATGVADSGPNSTNHIAAGLVVASRELGDSFHFKNSISDSSDVVGQGNSDHTAIGDHGSAGARDEDGGQTIDLTGADFIESHHGHGVGVTHVLHDLIV